MPSVRRVIFVLLIAAASACDDGPANPVIGSPPVLNLAGTWTGSIGTSQSGNLLRATWTLSQTAQTVTGPIALTRPADNLSFNGTLAGTLSGTRLTLTYTVPRGSVPGFPDCSMAGTGSTDASANTMLGTLTITYTNCQGYITQATTTESVTLAK